MPRWTRVKVYFGFPAGSSGDTVARRVAEKWAGSAFSKNPGVVENKPGAGGRIALETLKAAPADGSVLAVAQVSALANYPHIYSKMNYTDKDFAPVSIAANMHHGLAVGPMVPASVKTVKDFLAWAKANPKDASYGSPGAGSTPPFPGRAAGHQQRCGPAPCALPWLHPRYDGRGGRSGGCHGHAAR